LPPAINKIRDKTITRMTERRIAISFQMIDLLMRPSLSDRITHKRGILLISLCAVEQKNFFWHQKDLGFFLLGMSRALRFLKTVDLCSKFLVISSFRQKSGSVKKW
jgi:hypothetical protein